MEDDKIVLDRKSFEALAVDTRIKILKSLKERRKTLTEISKEEGMSVSGIKEHLEILESVGLIEKIDDGHKWKYYELTKKGKEVVGPKELRVMILLSMSILALIASAFVLLTPVSQPQAMPLESAPEMDTYAEAPMAPSVAGANEADAERKAFEEPQEEPEPQETRDDAVPLAVAFVSLVTLAGCLGILARNRMR